MRTVIVLVVLALAACGGSSTSTKEPGSDMAPPDPRTLYQRLGETEGITVVVKDFVATTGADPRIAQFFTNADIPRLEKLMVEQICAATGGPCTYSGKSMKESHTGMKVKEEHFAAFVEDLTTVLDRNKVGGREKSEVLDAFNSMKADVVEP